MAGYAVNFIGLTCSVGVVGVLVVYLYDRHLEEARRRRSRKRWCSPGEVRCGGNANTIYFAARCVINEGIPEDTGRTSRGSGSSLIAPSCTRFVATECGVMLRWGDAVKRGEG
ncbi:hypothetical protein GGR50DRAFT_693077 [Xylaria sp. CBS 124048]|nr:hypothetical protein GGR50DRAFT_693077 [Xylaria sp. CBS 124048]